jgi:hypothetical protein
MRKYEKKDSKQFHQYEQNEQSTLKIENKKNHYIWHGLPMSWFGTGPIMWWG